MADVQTPSEDTTWDSMARKANDTEDRKRNSTAKYVFPRHKLKTRMSDPQRTPLVVVACGSYSPVTYLHLRMFEMAYDYIADTKTERFEIIGGYFSPVSDAYAKPGLAAWYDRVDMCSLAVQDSSWIMVDSWEPSQSAFVPTAKTLDHFHTELNEKEGGYTMPDGTKKPIRILLLAGGDLIQSFAVPNLWKENDLYYILGGYGCIVIERTGANVHDFLLTSDCLFKHRKNVLVVKQYIHNDISSTKIRLFIKRGMSIRYLLPDPVIQYIHENGLYGYEGIGNDTVLRNGTLLNGSQELLGGHTLGNIPH